MVRSLHRVVSFGLESLNTVGDKMYRYVMDQSTGKLLKVGLPPLTHLSDASTKLIDSRIGRILLR